MQPQLGNILNRWSQDITLTTIVQTVDENFEVVNTLSSVSFLGVIQPLKPSSIKIKPAELRSLRWLQVHTKTTKVVKTNDIIVYNHLRYKIMDLLPYDLNGFREYHAVELLDE